MKQIDLIARILLGLLFVVFGLNFFFKFLPMPPLTNSHAKDFMGAMFATKFLMVVKIIEITGGAILLTGRLGGLGLLLLGPIIVCIQLFNLLVQPGFNPVGTAVGVLGAFLLILRIKPLMVFLKS